MQDIKQKYLFRIISINSTIQHIKQKNNISKITKLKFKHTSSLPLNIFLGIVNTYSFLRKHLYVSLFKFMVTFQVIQTLLLELPDFLALT